MVMDELRGGASGGAAGQNIAREKEFYDPLGTGRMS